MEIHLEPIKGLGLGLQYVDGYVDQDGEWFVVILELFLIRIMFYTLLKET